MTSDFDAASGTQRPAAQKRRRAPAGEGSSPLLSRSAAYVTRRLGNWQCGHFRPNSSNSPLCAPPMNACHSPGVNWRTGPPGYLLLRKTQALRRFRCAITHSILRNAQNLRDHGAECRRLVLVAPGAWSPFRRSCPCRQPGELIAAGISGRREHRFIRSRIVLPLAAARPCCRRRVLFPAGTKT